MVYFVPFGFHRPFPEKQALPEAALWPPAGPAGISGVGPHRRPAGRMDPAAPWRRAEGGIAGAAASLPDFSEGPVMPGAGAPGRKMDAPGKAGVLPEGKRKYKRVRRPGRDRGDFAGIVSNFWNGGQYVTK